MNLLGIDIGGTKTAVCIGNEQGEVRAARRMPSAADSLASYERDLAALCRAVITEAGLTLTQVDAVGLSAPGPLDCKRGVLIAPPNNPGWRNVPIVDMIRSDLGVPVYCNNDANACALAEVLYGAHRGAKNLVYLTFSTGMGGGIICNGELVQGPTDMGGEVGHMVFDPNGPLCGCGHRGCWEAYVGGRRVAESLKEKIRAGGIKTSIVEKAGGIEGINVEALLAAAREGDAFAVAEWDVLMERMAQGLGNLLMVLNPEVVVLGTIAIHAGDFALKPICEKLPKYAWPWTINPCTIAASSLAGRISSLAALAVAVDGLKHGAAGPQ